MASVLLTCEQLEYRGSHVGWRYCGAPKARLVTFPRTPPMVLCEEHEREATRNKASGVPALPEDDGDAG